MDNLKRLTNQKKWTDDIDLKNEFGYKHIFQRLCEYENTELTPMEVNALQWENVQLKKRLAKSVEVPCDIWYLQKAHCKICSQRTNDNLMLNMCNNNCDILIAGTVAETLKDIIKIEDMLNIKNNRDLYPNIFYGKKSKEQAEARLKELNDESGNDKHTT